MSYKKKDGCIKMNISIPTTIFLRCTANIGSYVEHTVSFIIFYAEVYSIRLYESVEHPSGASTSATIGHPFNGEVERGISILVLKKGVLMLYFSMNF